MQRHVSRSLETDILFFFLKFDILFSAFLCHISRESAQTKFYLRFITASGLNLYLLHENVQVHTVGNNCGILHIILHTYFVYSYENWNFYKQCNCRTIGENIRFYFWTRANFTRHFVEHIPKVLWLFWNSMIFLSKYTFTPRLKKSQDPFDE